MNKENNKTTEEIEEVENKETEKQFKTYEAFVSGRGWLHAMGIIIKKKGE